MVYVREIDGAPMTFVISGKLWRNSMTMIDEESGSIWSHITGRCMEGEHLDAQLEVVPSVQTTWAAWRKAYPGTRVLKKPGEIRSSRYEHYFTDNERAGMFRTFWLKDRMPAKALVHGITSGPHALAVPDELLTAGSEHTFDLAGEPVRVVRDEAGGVRAYGKDGEELQVLTSFWFAWSTFYPKTLVAE